MTALYLESSAVLCWLLGEPQADQVRRKVEASETVITSTITSVETERLLIRAELREVITQADRQRLRGLFARAVTRWGLVGLTDSVRVRAAARFPVEPVRGLDAIHLASALEATELYEEVSVLSFDQRIVDNLEPLGLRAA